MKNNYVQNMIFRLPIIVVVISVCIFQRQVYDIFIENAALCPDDNRQIRIPRRTCMNQREFSSARNQLFTKSITKKCIKNMLEKLVIINSDQNHRCFACVCISTIFLHLFLYPTAQVGEINYPLYISSSLDHFIYATYLL